MSSAVEIANVLHLRPSCRQKAAKAMTIIAGFRCKDGVVLAADTEITLDGGTGKTYASGQLVLASNDSVADGV